MRLGKILGWRMVKRLVDGLSERLGSRLDE